MVIIRDPAGVEPDDFFVTTDRTATGAEVASCYAGRWSIEVAFRDVKQHLGGQDPQSWKRRGPERAAALSLWLHALTWCWYLDTHPAGRTWTPRPWYPRKATPSFLDALAALRRTLWSQRITAMSGPARDNHQITDALLDTLAYAAQPPPDSAKVHISCCRAGPGSASGARPGLWNSTRARGGCDEPWSPATGGGSGVEEIWNGIRR